MGSYRTKEDDMAKISTSVFITNFPESFSAKELFHSCKQYGHVVDSFIPTKRLKSGKRFHRPPVNGRKHLPKDAGRVKNSNTNAYMNDTVSKNVNGITGGGFIVRFGAGKNDVELLRPVWIQCARNGFGSCGGDSDVEDGSRYFYLARRNDNVENLNDCNMEEANVIFSGNRSTMNLEDDAPDRMQAGKFSIITCKRFCKPDPQAVPWSAEISEVTIIGTKEDWRVRPISLIGSLYKIMQKFWPNRLVGCFGDIVNERFAIAFIADRVRFMMALFILNEVLGGGQGERTVFNFK
ncbi:nucleotide-binding alpha-beta plait domain-containing protein [Tanacetum coccineum]